MPGHRYLLDTNILSSLIRQPSGPVARKISAIGEGAICTSIVVACELRYGAAKKGSASLTNKVEQMLSVLEVLALDKDADRQYGELHTALERAGSPIGANGYLIAAHALSLGLTLVTDNVAEFSMVPGLVTENWAAG